MKTWHKDAIVFALAIVGWLLLPEITAMVALMTVVAASLLVILAYLAIGALLVWLIGPLTLVDIPRYLYRRYLAAYVRLRRMQRNRNLRQWQEAAARGGTEK